MCGTISTVLLSSLALCDLVSFVLIDFLIRAAARGTVAKCEVKLENAVCPGAAAFWSISLHTSSVDAAVAVPGVFSATEALFGALARFDLRRSANLNRVRSVFEIFGIRNAFSFLAKSPPALDFRSTGHGCAPIDMDLECDSLVWSSLSNVLWVRRNFFRRIEAFDEMRFCNFWV